MKLRRLYKLLPVVLAVLSLVFGVIACGSETPEVRTPPADTGDQAGEEVAEESDQGPTSTSAPEPTATPRPVGSARSNPAPVGSEVTVDQKTFLVTEVIRPADEIIRAGNTFNEEPEEGQEYIMVDLSVTCEKSSDDTCTFSEFEFSVVGDNGLKYDAKFFVVGVDGLLGTGEFFGGATKSGYIPFIVDSDDSNLVLIYEALLGSEAYLSIDGAAE